MDIDRREGKAKFSQKRGAADQAGARAARETTETRWRAQWVR